jgi:hypothetical protein
MTNMTPDERAFHMKEVDYLRKEIEYRTLDQSRIERDVVIAVSVVYAALATLDPTKLTPVVEPQKIYFWFIPFFIVAVGWAKFAANLYAIDYIGKYIRDKLEKRFDPDELGWESWIESHRKDKNKIPSRIRRYSWHVLFLITIVIPTVFYFRQ